MLVTDNDEWAAKARLLRSHGVTRNPLDFLGLDDASPQASSSQSVLSESGPWYYEMQDLGYNYRITDIQCALGRSQLNRLPDFVIRRREIALRYNEAFAGLKLLDVPTLFAGNPSPATSSGFAFSPSDLSLHLYTVQIDFDRLGKTRTEVMRELRDQDVGSQVLYIPVYLQPWYRRTFSYSSGKCPNAERFYGRALSLPLSAGMSDPDVEQVIAVVQAIL
jgi:dTDP-4-amino-4,6-dideoxygalactose transaminase